jgi:hypothetical protein
MTQPMPGGRRRVDRVLAPDFLDSLVDLPLDEVRRRRREAEQEEADLSYLRRMLHGRMDIVRAEQRRRASGDDVSVVEHLAEILSDPNRATRGMGKHYAVEPSRVDEHRRSVEKAIADAVVSDVSARSDDELAAALRSLQEHEHEVSEVRGRVQKVADALSGEIARRYKDGSASVDDLLAPGLPE